MADSDSGTSSKPNLAANQDLIDRIKGGIFLLPLIVLLYLGGGYLLAFLMLLSALMGYEFGRMITKKAGPAAGLALWLVCPAFLAWLGAPAVWLLAFVGLSVFGLLYFRKISVVYLILLGLCFYALIALQRDAMHLSFDLLALVVIISAVDIGAYCVGRLVGGPKLAPAISPGKTISGGMGGVLAGCLSYGVLTAFVAVEAWPLWMLIIVTLLAQAGDLLESALKRQYQIKDSGQLIPGHGGVLDRFDGYVLTVPFIWFFGTYLTV